MVEFMHGLQQDFQPLLKWSSLNLSVLWYRSIKPKYSSIELNMLSY